MYIYRDEAVRTHTAAFNELLRPAGCNSSTCNTAKSTSTNNKALCSCVIMEEGGRCSETTQSEILARERCAAVGELVFVCWRGIHYTSTAKKMFDK